MNSKFVSIISSIGLVLTACIWGFAFVVVKDSLDYVGPLWMIAFRFTIAAVGLALIFCKKFKLLNKKTLFQGAVLGFFLFFAYVVQTIGCDYTTAGKNAFLTAVYVVFIPLIYWPLYKKRPAWYVFLASVLCLLGIGFLALNPSDKGGINIGDVLTLICGVFYALHIIFVEKWNNSSDAILLTVLQFLFASVYGWILAAIVQNPEINGPFPVEAFTSSKVILSMLYLGIFSTMIAFLCQNVCLKYVNSALASLFLSLESVFGVIFSCVFLHESLSPRMIAGCVLIFTAILISEVLPKLKNN